jgi:calmodulin
MPLSADQVAELKAAFSQMDANGDGYVTKDELKAMLAGLGETVEEAVVNEMIAVADTNGDGKVDFNEFVAAATTG